MDTRKASRSLASRYVDLLSEEGYRPRIASEDEGPTVIHFKSDGEAFLLLVEDEDPSFFHLASAYDLGDVDLAAAMSRANDLSEELKGVKVTVWAPDRSLRLHVEAFLDEPPVSLAVLERGLGAIRNAAHKFFEPARAPDRLDA